MDDDKKKQVEKLITGRPCARGCKCYKVDFEDLCKASSFGVESLLECLEDEPEKCVFAFPFGGSYFCKCGLRLDIAKILDDDK